jgi:hypothetical protein
LIKYPLYPEHALQPGVIRDAGLKCFRIVSPRFSTFRDRCRWIVTSGSVVLLAQTIRSSNSPSLAPSTNAVISARV